MDGGSLSTTKEGALAEAAHAGSEHDGDELSDEESFDSSGGGGEETIGHIKSGDAISRNIRHHDMLRKHQKLDLPNALVSLGTSLVTALSSANAEYVESRAVAQDIDRVQHTHREIMNSLERLRNAVDESREVNVQLLEFLKQHTLPN
ncbi:unnamed protein product [Phytophthora fragariaefolia]|uniref:Unnamed protein product n=1 Tax=Phytophthora fragariaefolia TaxID=1490495 RepID=A0A9W6TXJ1_9STRA|nr:unnamed protein product [Phytophthora fragariaefolia]